MLVAPEEKPCSWQQPQGLISTSGAEFGYGSGRLDCYLLDGSCFGFVHALCKWFSFILLRILCTVCAWINLLVTKYMANSSEGKMSPIYLCNHKFFSTDTQGLCVSSFQHPSQPLFAICKQDIEEEVVSWFINLKFSSKGISADEDSEVNLCRYYIINYDTFLQVYRKIWPNLITIWSCSLVCRTISPQEHHSNSSWSLW